MVLLALDTLQVHSRDATNDYFDRYLIRNYFFQLVDQSVIIPVTTAI